MAIADRNYERINEYTAVSIQLASPNDIRSWSYGEVKKPETINYRTYRAEKDGLFCERIFGPERDWECFCGKYKGIKYKDIICDRCGVKIAPSKVRRTRMGHINLAAPVVHIWFFRALPNRLGTLLDMKSTAVQQVAYFQRYVVTDPGETPLLSGGLLSEEQYREAREKYGEDAFAAAMGAESLRTLLRALDPPKLSVELRAQLKVCKSQQRREQIVKRLRLVEAFISSGNSPDWMVMDVIPVIPPDLRPLVPLESGNFATSDLNDLYRRVINRNNRLKKLLDLNAPGVIIRNEKRMLQQAVDALFDNGRTKRPVLGTGNRPLKSLTDMIKGKQGRFRENLLGKRVDYSARSVIVVGPHLRLDQCGIPKKIALELFQPFIIRKLKERGYADTIKSAKKILERKDEIVWDVLEEVIARHQVLLNRAPTLHRMGIQAFYPILIEGESIQIHPLICRGFNADFDGDQMAVHLPLSLEAQAEANLLMLSTNNIFSPAHGEPIISPDLDIVLGCYFLTVSQNGVRGEGKVFRDVREALFAWEHRKIDTHALIRVRLGQEVEVVDKDDERLEGSSGVYETTAGRVIFSDILPEGMPFYNHTMNGKLLARVVSACHQRLGREATVRLLDAMKDLGFHWATLSGLSFSMEDLKVPLNKRTLLAAAEKEVDRVERAYQRGVITDDERYNQVIDAWTHVRTRVWDELMTALREDTHAGDPNFMNPIFAMVDSGARGSVQQIGQLAGMRGLMAKPSGKVIETPIKANFKEGLRGFEYFSSTHGARKGLADTALKTAHSGYLTRTLVEVAQDVVITMEDCGTTNGITKGIIYRGEQVEVSLSEAIWGRVARDSVVDLVTDEQIVQENELVTDDIAKRIEGLNYAKLRVRSPLTCEADFGVCAKCYGMDLSTGQLVEIGTAAGVIAAQSLGEPGTQLTMRTFHIGGIGITHVEESEVRSKQAGTIRFYRLNAVTNSRGQVVALNRNGEIVVEDERGRELDRYLVPIGAVLQVKVGEKIPARKILSSWDPHMIPILTEIGGKIRFDDIVEDVTMRREVDPNTGFERLVIVEHRGDRHPQIVIEGEHKDILGVYAIPEKAHIEIREGEGVAPGTILAKTPREITGSQDITGGLPRVTELFEARKPKDAAIMSEIDGVVELRDRKRGKRMIVVRSDSGLEREYLIPHGRNVLAHGGDQIRAGDRLVDGPLVLQDILRISGGERLENYILNEVQSVYRAQNVRINDKHLEILTRQMLRKVTIVDPGDTDFLPTDTISKIEFKRRNAKVIETGGKPATATPQLLGITKASLGSDSFVAAASFQETTKVLTEAAIAGRVDYLRGLKENVILGHIIPAGTGFPSFYRSLVGREEPEPEVLAPQEEPGETPAAPAELPAESTGG